MEWYPADTPAKILRPYSADQTIFQKRSVLPPLLRLSKISLRPSSSGVVRENPPMQYFSDDPAADYFPRTESASDSTALPSLPDDPAAQSRPSTCLYTSASPPVFARQRQPPLPSRCRWYSATIPLPPASTPVRSAQALVPSQAPASNCSQSSTAPNARCPIQAP